MIGVDNLSGLFDQIRPEHAEMPIAGLPVRVLSDWLELSIRDDKINGLGLLAYGKAADYIIGAEDLPHGLMLFAKSEGTNFVIKLRQACGLAIEKLDFSRPDDIRTADVILQLSANIGATSVLGELIKKVPIVPPDTWPAEFYQVALELTRMSAHSDAEWSAALLRHLIAARTHFPGNQVKQTLIALTKAEPQHFVDHWALLADAIQAKYGSIDDLRRHRMEEERVQARDELLADLTMHMPDKRKLLLGQRAGSGQPVQTPDWWIDTLIRAKDHEVRRVLRDLVQLPDWTPRSPSASSAAALSRISAQPESLMAQNTRIDFTDVQIESDNDNLEWLVTAERILSPGR